jgi:polysaccharide deacetylase 2 family uncharacterized protein YibQ
VRSRHRKPERIAWRSAVIAIGLVVLFASIAKADETPALPLAANLVGTAGVGGPQIALLPAALSGVRGILAPKLLEPWRRNAAVAQIAAGQPAIAIVMDDLGTSARQVERIMALRAPIVMSFLPDGAEAPALAARARRAGHEILLHIPMEPNELDHNNPGRGALFVTDGTDKIRGSLGNSLDRFEGFVGINNHMGSRFTRDWRAMSAVLGELKSRGLMFLDSKTTLGSAGALVAQTLDLPYAVRDVFIDDSREPDAVAFQLQRLERVSRKKGIAVAIGHPNNVTLDALAAWLPQARARGFAIVPISYVAARGCAC